MITLKHHQVPDAITDIRLVDYVVHVFPEICSRSAAKKSIKRGEILINNNNAEQGEWVMPGQVISLIDLQNKPPKIFELKLEIVFEDDHLAIIYKPAGISVSGNKYKTIVNALPFNLKTSKSEDALKWPLPVHRLDYPTSGLLLIAKTRSAQIKLGKQFENKQIKKVYHAIIVGDIAKKGIINQSIDGQDAVTEYKLLKKEPSLKVNTISLVQLMPQTGRTHQLRIHLSAIGHPIIGDDKYGNDFPLLKGKGLFLSALGLEFVHPITNEKCKFQIDQPQKFTSFLERESRRWKKYNV